MGPQVFFSEVGHPETVSNRLARFQTETRSPQELDPRTAKNNIRYNQPMLRIPAWAALLFSLTASGMAETARESRFLSFSAKDRHGIFLRDLKPEEVTLLVGNQPIEVRYFGYQDVDAALAFLIENSPRTARYAVSMPHLGRVNIVDQVRYHLSGGFFDELALNSRVLIAEFYKELKILQDFSEDGYLLDGALRRMKPNFSPLDKENIPVGRMIGRGVDLLRQRPEKRKILVVFTTTVDYESAKNLEEYREMLRSFDVDLFVVSFASRQATGPGRSHTEKINRFYFKRLAEETSGRLYLSGEYVFPREFMDDLMTRLTHSYTLGFYVSPGEQPAEHSIEIKIDRPKCDLTYRKKLVF